MVSGQRSGLVGALAAELSEAEASRRVFLTAGGLVLLGIVLLIGTVAWWRSTRVDHPALAPLEVMGERRWMKASLYERRRLIDGVRPRGSKPMRPVKSEPAPVDLTRHDQRVIGFDDLRELDALLGALVGGVTNGAVGETVAANGDTELGVDLIDPIETVDAIEVVEDAESGEDPTVEDPSVEDPSVEDEPAQDVTAIDPLLQRLSKPD